MLLFFGQNRVINNVVVDIDIAVVEDPRNLPLKFRQIEVSNRSDITDFVYVVGGVVVGVHVQSHFHVKPNLF